MDGQTIESDPRTAEYLRQKEIYAYCLDALNREALRKEAGGYAVMAAMYAFAPASRGEGRLGKAVTFSKFFLIAAVGIIPNLLVISVLLN